MNLTFKIFVYVIFIFVFVDPAISNQASDISYNIKYLADQPNCIDLRVMIKGNKEGKHLLKLPTFVRNVAFEAQQGILSYSMVDDRIFWLNTDPNVDVKSNYKACSSNLIKDNGSPILSKDFFSFLIGELLILSNDDSKLMNVQITFENFPEYYNFITNHSFGHQKYDIKDTPYNLSRSILTGGKFDIETLFVNKKPIHVVIHGKWKMFTIKELKRKIVQLIERQRSLLKDNDFNYFVVLLYDNEGLSKQGAASGMLYNNVLRMLLIDSEEKKKGIFFGSLSHELFHAWIGNKIKIPAPQGELQWFFEGVNDFYGWQLALDSGVISEKDFVTYYNKILNEYLVSPYRDDSNETIAEIFNLRNPAGRLALVRGHIVFMEILNKLNSQNKSRAEIDLALREIDQNFSNKNKKITQEALDRIFKKHIGEEIWNQASDILYNGKPIILSDNLISRKNKLSTTKVAIPNFGFNLKQLLKEKRIISLDTNSNAALAGLKEADEVIYVSFDTTTADDPVYITIKGSDQHKVVQFVPNKSEKTIQQYRQIPSIPR